MDAREAKPGAVPVWRCSALDVREVAAGLAKSCRQAAWNAKLIPVRMLYGLRQWQRAFADAFPAAREPLGLAQKCRPAGRESRTAGGIMRRKAGGRDSSGNLQGRAELCKCDSCPLAAELSARERELAAREKMEWLAGEEIAAVRREVMERARAVEDKAREVRARERAVAEREAAVEARERRAAGAVWRVA